MAAPLVYAPDGRARVLFSSRPGPYDTDSLIEFLGELHVELDGEKITPIWDGLTDHRSRAIRAFLARQRHWLVIERLPPTRPS
jgi:putative transposase